MISHKKTIIKASFIALLLLGTLCYIPVSSLQVNQQQQPDSSNIESNDEQAVLDRRYVPDPDFSASLADDNDDAGYKKDAGNNIDQAADVYPGEMEDDLPGRGRTGKLSTSDTQDWYRFSVCQGQQFTIIMTPPTSYDFDLTLWDTNKVIRATSSTGGSAPETIIFTADTTGIWKMQVLFVTGSGQGQYSFDITMNTQNDSGIHADAGNAFATATLISPGSYYGYVDMNDEFDWYKFTVNVGQGIHVQLLMKGLTSLSDFDIALYNPSGTLVYEENKYYNDELWYPADVSGEWRIQIHIFPGYTDIPQPTEWYYYTYGSGAYNLVYSVEASAPAPPAPIPQPEITPIAKTFTVNNVPNNYADDYGYLAAIPACNYISGGKRYLAPIVYDGDDTPTAYYDDEYSFGVVDDTTQYLIDDWNAYLLSHGKTPDQYTVPADPVTAAAEIATQNWGSSSLAVVAVDGSTYQDEVSDVLNKQATLKRSAKVVEIASDDPKIKEFGYPLFLTPKWGAVSVSLIGGAATTEPTLNQILPKFINFISDFWPDYAGQDKTDIFYPVTRMGLWSVSANTYTGNWQFRIAQLAGDRYRIRIGDQDTTLKVTVTTAEENDLVVFLVDPSGYLRAPDLPYWNGGPVNPMHEWNGFPNATGFDQWRLWDPAPHTEFTAEVLHPEKGTWTAVVVPRHETGEASNPYTITGTVKTINTKGADAAVSAANAAVIASLNHAPLLYVTEDSVPAATASALTSLGVTKVIFVERGEIGSGVRDDLPTIETDLKTMQEIIDYIKDSDFSENYLTITSLKTGDGFFAPAAMLAAYHGSPVLRIEEAEGNPAGLANQIETWRLWSGDYYHGERSCGHLPKASSPVEKSLKLVINMTLYFITGGKKGSLPAFGMDADRYWHEELYTGMYNWINGYGLDREGQEAFCFVAPRNDIYIPLLMVLMGNNSYTGQIPGMTPAYSATIINRNILYPAIIFANPNRNVTTSQLMNFGDIKGGYNQWTTNDGKLHTLIASSSETKYSFSSHFRNYQGHCLWDAHLQQMNEGASIMYYSGHGTGGSGISAQYLQSEHSLYPDQVWWDSWRSYMYDNWKMPRDEHWHWYNPNSPNLYDFIHYKYVDQFTENLRSNAIFYMSCTTGDADGPMVYLDHGAVMWYGNAATGLCPPDNLRDDMYFKEIMIDGETVGAGYSKLMWLFTRDFTSGDEHVMYGTSSMQLFTLPTIYGDPNLIIYSPEWTSPMPIDA